MKRLLFAALVVFALGACVDENGDTAETDVTSESLSVIEKEHNGITYTCLFVYVDGYQAGGPAMWCERKDLG